MDENFESVINGVWRQERKGNRMYKVITKLKLLKQAFKRMDVENFSHIEKRVDMMHLALHHCQQELWNDPQNQSLLTAAEVCTSALIKL